MGTGKKEREKEMMSQIEGACDKDECVYFAEWEMRKDTIFVGKTLAQRRSPENFWNVKPSTHFAFIRCPLCIHFRKMEGFVWGAEE